ncbi:hypothetical protein [Methanobrevibacter millerae]|uniref:Uncharacterized protein n=1 Tax=Methanobrevibacter millerae TaxID=230361 RepID=A0A1G5VHW3_9EURY|nr:hypothetical protein [Methanobrevibacter millerae]SDA45344.1 hypothetical protein SAMN02910315_00617 [Methanobrevibacter millerae]
MIDENYTEITPDKINEVEKTLNSGFCDYKLKDSEFNIETFENSKDITLIQTVGEEEIELLFKTKEDDGKYFINSSFEIISDDLLEGHQTRDVFQSVNMYFRNVIANPDEDFTEEKESLINFLTLTDEKYNKDNLEILLDPDKIRSDYNNDHDRIYSEEDLTDIQKSLALKELLHMSICEVIDDLELYFTRPLDLSPAEEHEKNRQEAKALENEMKLY